MRLTTAQNGSDAFCIVDADLLHSHHFDPDKHVLATYKTQREADLHIKRTGHGRAQDRDYFLRRYPRLCAHVICESLGYATPSVAAMIVKDAHNGQENWCEWIDACYRRRPEKAVKDAVRNRARHSGYMSEYRRALAIVQRANTDGSEPMLASWF
jgi:hypothetical protein